MWLNNSRFEKIVRAVGWIIFAFAVLYVYVFPFFVSPPAPDLLNARVEGTLVVLIALYLYSCKSATVPWLVLLVLSVGELSHEPAKGVVMALLSLAMAVTLLG